MKISIVGVGGVGGYFGGLLANAGLDVTFVARGEQYKALKENGLTLKTVEGDFLISNPNVVDSISKLVEPDLVLICSKVYDLEQIGKELSSVLKPSSIVIPLSNGIDNDQTIKKYIKDTKVYPGFAYIISARTALGVIEQTAGPCTMFFGERGVSNNLELKEIEKIFKEAGLKANYAPDIEKEIWRKFIWLSSFSGMTAICRSAIGKVANSPDAFNLLVRCIDEALAVASSLGIEFDAEDRADIVAKVEAYKTTGMGAKASLLVDIENNRKTEIESISGAIVRLGRNKGIDVPCHEMIYTSVKLSTMREPS